MCMGADSSKSDGGMTGAARAMHRRNSPSTDDVDYVVGRGSDSRGSSSGTASSGSASPVRTLLNSRSRNVDKRKITKKLTTEFGRGGKQRTNIFTGLSRVGKSLITQSPTFQFFKGLSETYKGN